MNRTFLAAAITVAFCSSASAQIDVRNDSRAEAEYLAVEITGALQASTALADQIQHDLASIRAAFPNLADIRVLPSWMPGEVLIDFDRPSFDSIKAGTYTGFDSVFSQLGLPQISLRGDHPSLTPGVHLEFATVYHGQRLAEIFDDVPGAIHTWPNHIVGGGDDIIARANRTYTLSRGFGDCPAGCIYRQSWSFAVTDGVGGPFVSPVPEPAALAAAVWLIALLPIRRIIH